MVNNKMLKVFLFDELLKVFLTVCIVEYCRLSTGALSRLILSDDSLRLEVNELRASKVGPPPFLSLSLLHL